MSDYQSLVSPEQEAIKRLQEENKYLRQRLRHPLRMFIEWVADNPLEAAFGTPVCVGLWVALYAGAGSVFGWL